MAATRATKALREAGLDFTVHTYHHDAQVRDFGNEAVAGINGDPDRVFKTLIVDSGLGLAVGVVPVSTQLDLKSMALALGVKKLAMAKQPVAEKSTGYVVGGISPIAQRTPLPTIVDETALLFDTIFVSAGQRGLQVELAPSDLAAAISATFADIAR